MEGNNDPAQIPAPEVAPETPPTTALARAGTAGMPQASEKVKAERLTPSSRKEFRDAIKNRSSGMLRALKSTIGGDVDEIITDLRMKAGMQFSERQLKDLIAGCDEQIRGEVQNHLGPEKRRVESEIEKLNDSFDTRERAMKARHKEEYSALMKEKRELQESFKLQLVNAEETVRKTHTPTILDRKNRYQTELARVREVEATITATADTQVKLIKSRRDRLENLVEDATARALEQLLIVETRADAANLVYMIPTVQDAINLCRTAHGLAELMHKLDSSYQIPPEEELAKEDREVVEGSVVPSDSDDDDDDDDDDEDDEDEELDVESSVAGNIRGLDVRDDDDIEQELEEVYENGDSATVRVNQPRAGIYR